MKSRFFCALAALAAIATATPSQLQACSVIDSYRVPTNLELAEEAHLILRAEVIGERVGKDAYDRSLIIQPLEALKGTMPPGPLEIADSGLVPEDDTRGWSILSNPYALEDAHPLSYIGGCIRYMFPKNTTALFFLENADGNWRPAGGPFSRWAEDIVGEQAPWVQLTRLYARVAAAKPEERQAMLDQERDRYLAMSNPVARLMALDIQRQSAGPNRTWNAMIDGAIDGDGDLPKGAEEEVAAAAIADLVTQSTGRADPLDEISAESAVSLCTMSEDRSNVECDGLYFRRVEPDEKSPASGNGSPSDR